MITSSVWELAVVLVETSAVLTFFFLISFSALTFSAFFWVISSFNLLTLEAKFSHLFSSFKFSLSLTLINFLRVVYILFQCLNFITILFNHYFISVFLLLFFIKYVLRAEASICQFSLQVHHRYLLMSSGLPHFSQALHLGHQFHV